MKAIYAVMSSDKNNSYPNCIVDFKSSINREEAKLEWKALYPNHTIWSFDFVMYVQN